MNVFKSFLFCAVVVLDIAAHAESTIEKYTKYAETRRYCVSRVVVGDKIITTWHRNGSPDWILPAVETNQVRTITGKTQNNPLQNELVAVNARLLAANTKLQTALSEYVTATNRAQLAEMRLANTKARLTEDRATWQTKYDSASVVLKPVYKLGLDLIDAMLEKVDGE